MSSGYTVNDRRGKEREDVEVCRVCGSKVVHSRAYEKPTFECVKFFRTKIQELEMRALKAEGMKPIGIEEKK